MDGFEAYVSKCARKIHNTKLIDKKKAYNEIFGKLKQDIKKEIAIISREDNCKTDQEYQDMLKQIDSEFGFGWKSF